MKFRKKPVVIEAEQFIIVENMSDSSFKISNVDGVYRDGWSKTGWSIKTLEGKHEVTEGDWIITGVKGEIYPIKDEIFKLTYDKVKE